MNRQEMERVINEGGSVLHEGRLITKHENLPSNAVLAKTDEEKAKSKDELDAKIEALIKEREALAHSANQPQNQIEGDKPQNQNTGNSNVKTDAETPESLLKLSNEDLLKRAGEVGKATNQQFDSKATKEVLVKFILSGANKPK